MTVARFHRGRRFSHVKRNEEKSENKVETYLISPILMCSTFIATVSIVVIVFATAMIYIPYSRESSANIDGPYKCTTLHSQYNVTNTSECTWSSCVDWCLNKVNHLR